MRVMLHEIMKWKTSVHKTRKNIKNARTLSPRARFQGSCVLLAFSVIYIFILYVFLLNTCVPCVQASTVAKSDLRTTYDSEQQGAGCIPYVCKYSHHVLTSTAGNIEANKAAHIYFHKPHTHTHSTSVILPHRRPHKKNEHAAGSCVCQRPSIICTRWSNAQCRFFNLARHVSMFAGKTRGVKSRKKSHHNHHCVVRQRKKAKAVVMGAACEQRVHKPSTSLGQ